MSTRSELHTGKTLSTNDATRVCDTSDVRASGKRRTPPAVEVVTHRGPTHASDDETEENTLPLPLPLADVSIEHQQLESISTDRADASKSLHYSIAPYQRSQIWAAQRTTSGTFDEHNSIRRTRALRALRTQLLPMSELNYRAGAAATENVRLQDAELAKINPRDMTDDQLVRWRKLQHDDQWNLYNQVHSARCDADFLYHFMFAEIGADHAARCLRYFRLVSAVENLVIGRYGEYVTSIVAARWRWYAIPCNWSPKAWSTAVGNLRKRSATGDDDRSVEQLIDQWLRDPKTSPKAPSYFKKTCEEWLLLTMVVHVPEFAAYLLADRTSTADGCDVQSAQSAPLLVDSRGASMLLLTGDGRELNRPGQPIRFTSIANLWMCVAQGRPMDPTIVALSHTNRMIDCFTDPSPDVYTGPITPLIASTMAPHEHTMAATPAGVVRYFKEQYPLVTRVVAPQVSQISSTLNRR